MSVETMLQHAHHAITIGATANARIYIEGALDLLGAAYSPDSRGPASAVESGEHGAAGPRDTGTFGEVGPTVGSSASGRPAAPLSRKRATARTVTPHDAGL